MFMVITSLQLKAACSLQEERTKYFPVMATWGLRQQPKSIQNTKKQKALKELFFFEVKLMGRSWAKNKI